MSTYNIRIRIRIRVLGLIQRVAIITAQSVQIRNVKLKYS